MTQHPDLDQEQAYVDHAYDCLERTRQDAWRLRNLTAGGLGGTFQARYERDVFDEAIVSRLTQLDLGEAAGAHDVVVNDWGVGRGVASGVGRGAEVACGLAFSGPVTSSSQSRQAR